MKTGSVTTDYRTAAQTLIGHLDGQIAELYSIRTGLMGLVTHDGLRTVGACRSEIEAATLGTKPPKAGKVAGISQKHPWRTPAGRIFAKEPPGEAAETLEEKRAVVSVAAASPAPVVMETAGASKRLGAETRAAMVTMLKLPEPFTAASVAVATGMDAKRAGIMLWRLCEGGYLKKVATGEYERTREFPFEL